MMRPLIDLWASRELLANLVSRDIRGKYKRTVLGQAWSLLNPLALMLIFTMVFGFIFRIETPPGDPSGLDNYALFLLCGLLPWLFFSNVLNMGLASLVDNAGLIQKVYFNRLVLPFAVVGSSAYNWMFEMGVLAIALLIAGAMVIPWLPLVAVAMLLTAMFAGGLALMLSMANVHFRDTQYFMALILQLWMYLSPIVYPMTLVEKQSEQVGELGGTSITILDIYELNPMVHFVALFRQLLYDNRWPDAEQWLWCAGWAVVTLAIGIAVFRRHEKTLAEVL